MINRKINKYKRLRRNQAQTITEIEELLKKYVHFDFYVYESTETNSGELMFADLLLGNDMELEVVLQLIKARKVLTQQIWMNVNEV